MKYHRIQNRIHNKITYIFLKLNITLNHVIFNSYLLLNMLDIIIIHNKKLISLN